jgi:hypothetical protein
MKQRLAAWKIAALASSLALGAAFVGWRTLRASPDAKPSPVAPPPAVGAPETPPQAEPGEPEYFPGSKSMILEDGKGGAFRGRGGKRTPPPAEGAK